MPPRPRRRKNSNYKLADIKAPKARHAQVPGYWVKNVEGLQNILEGIVYFDLMQSGEYWHVYICDVPFDNKEHEVRRLTIMSFLSDDVNRDYPEHRDPQVGDFWEPSVLATALTVLGIEVMYGVINANCNYLSYTDSLAFKVFDHGHDEDINQVVGTSEPMEVPAVKKINLSKNRTSVFDLMDPDELD